MKTTRSFFDAMPFHQEEILMRKQRSDADLTMQLQFFILMTNVATLPNECVLDGAEKLAQA